MNLSPDPDLALTPPPEDATSSAQADQVVGGATSPDTVTGSSRSVSETSLLKKMMHSSPTQRSPSLVEMVSVTVVPTEGADSHSVSAEGHQGDGARSSPSAVDPGDGRRRRLAAMSEATDTLHAVANRCRALRSSRQQSGDGQLSSKDLEGMDRQLEGYAEDKRAAEASLREAQDVVRELSKKLEKRRAAAEKQRAELEQMIERRKKDLELISTLKESAQQHEERHLLLVSENRKLKKKLEKVTADCNTAVESIKAVSTDALKHLSRCVEDEGARVAQLEAALEDYGIEVPPRVGPQE